MAYSTITDFYNPTLFDKNLVLKMLEKNLLLRSGVAIRDARIAKMINGMDYSRKIDLPYIGAIANDEPNVSNDDGGTTSTPKKMSGSKCTAIACYLNQSWSNMDLATYFTGADPLSAVVSGIAKYWDTQYQRRMVATLQGVIADNVANDSGDMVNDISSSALLTDPTDAQLISASAVINTELTSGDRMDEYVLIICHSTVAARLKVLNLIDFIPDSEGVVQFKQYQDKYLLVDDSMPVASSGTNADGSTKYAYTTYLLGRAQLAFEDVDPPFASEVDRTPASGNGGGQTTLYSRRGVVIHPYGFNWEEASMASDAPTLAELRLAVNWDRKWERKRIQIAALVTNG